MIMLNTTISLSLSLSHKVIINVADYDLCDINILCYGSIDIID